MQNKVLFIDACRKAISGEKGTIAIGHEAKSVLDREGIAMFFSCDPKDRSYEIDEIKHSSLTFCILNAINDGIHRSIAQIDSYLRESVPMINQKYKKPAQMPFLILSPSEIGNLLLFAPEKTVAQIYAVEEMMAILGGHCEEDDLDVIVYSKAVDVLIRVRDQTTRPLDERKHAIIRNLCDKEVSVESFGLAWKILEKGVRNKIVQQTVRAHKVQ